jgi:cell division protein ZipA
MPELRWILIALGVLFVAGLWFWETRRGRAAAESPPTERPLERTEPTLQAGEETEGAPVPDEQPALEPAPIRATRRERVGPPDPPIVEIPAGVEPELARRPPPEPELPLKISYRDIQDELDALPPDLEKRIPTTDEYSRSEPWVRTQPLDRNELRKAQAEEDAAAAAEAGSSQQEAGESTTADGASARQRIVALRLIAGRDRWNGKSVIEALEAEGLTFGKYSIFHRAREDGKSIFYVASMVEPGSFDPEVADTLSFPGISVFAVIPGAVDAPTTFDMMLATAKRLAERLGGQLQDEQGSTLTMQRVLSLREEIVHFEHVSRRLRGS